MKQFLIFWAAFAALALAGCQGEGPAEETGKAIDETAEEMSETAGDLTEAVEDEAASSMPSSAAAAASSTSHRALIAATPHAPASRHAALFWAARLPISFHPASCPCAKRASSRMKRSRSPIRSNMVLMKWKCTKMRSSPANA